MSTDRKLLELAAKAAGLVNALPAMGCGIVYEGGKYWNPLADDGDALRLAVKLAIEVVPDANGGRAYRGTRPFIEESVDRFAATRRAIVRAAAEIGKAMP